MLARTALRRFIPPRVRQSIKKTLAKAKTRREVPKLLRSRPDFKLEIGSGPVKGKDGWITMDLCEGADLCWDLHDSLPFPENSVTMIYCSHALEHFYYPQIMRLLKDCLKILKPSGTLRACVPDAEIWVKGYMKSKHLDQRYFRHEPAVISREGIDILNYIAYMDGAHKHMFDRESVVRVLSQAGFGAVQLTEFDPALDLPKHRHESLYVTCTKG